MGQLGADPKELAAMVRKGDSRSVDAVATNFESMFLSQLVKEMRQTLDPHTMFGEDGGDVQGGLFDFYMGQHLAQSGGIGIGAMLKRQLEATHKI